MLLRLVPQQTDIKFLSARKIAFVFSIVAILGSIGLFFTKSLNYGIDFRGGISIEIGTNDDSAIPLSDVRRIVGGLGLGDVQVQEFGRPSEALIRIARQPGDAKAQTDAMSLVRGALSAEIENITFRQENVVGPKVSGELKRDGTIAVTIAVLAVLIYIWLRFEWQFGLCAVIALVHDVALTIGFFSITELEFNLSIIAALLTIVGYSLNDTVVVYDRVRENIRKFQKMELEDLLNFSLNQTLSRTVMTSVTTLLALGALFFLGGEVIKGFTAAMIWGVLIGTYSSIFIAAPMLLQLNLRREALIPQDDRDPTVDKSRATNPFEHIG